MGDVTKEVLIIRKDLRMRRGKEIVSGSHAAVAPISGRLRRIPFTRIRIGVMTPAMDEWLDGSFRKIAVQVDSEAELLAVRDAAAAAGLPYSLITDAGYTEFHGIPTVTCLSVGPAYDSELKPVTGHLKLY